MENKTNHPETTTHTQKNPFVNDIKKEKGRFVLKINFKLL